MNNNSNLFVEKYRPHSLSDVVGHNKAIDEIRNWAHSWLKKMPEKRAIVLYGKAGTGKTSSAYALANEMKWNVLELNASDQRTALIINTIVGNASQLSTLEGNKKRLILIDEVDNLHGNADRGGEKAIIKLIKKTKHPIILTANEYYELSSELRDICEPVQFMALRNVSIVNVLRRICVSENIKYENGVLEKISDNSNGDMRAAINDLQLILDYAGSFIKISDVGEDFKRDTSENVFKLLEKIFKESSLNNVYMSTLNSHLNPEDLIYWIDENVSNEYKKDTELEKSYEYLSKASKFLGRVKKRRDYSMWKYANVLMASGVMVSKNFRHGGYTAYGYPSIWKKMSTNKIRKGVYNSILEKIGRKCHCSKRTAKNEVISYVKLFMRSEYAVRIVSELDLSVDEIKYLINDDMKKVENIFNNAQKLEENFGVFVIEGDKNENFE